MPERGRGRSPGAKGTAFPAAARPQKALPPRPPAGLAAKPGRPFGAAAKPPVDPSARAHLTGKTLQLAKPPASAQEAPRGGAGKPVPSTGRPAAAAGKPAPSAGRPEAAVGKSAPSIGRPPAGGAKPVSAISRPPAGKPTPSVGRHTPAAPADPNAPVRISKLLAERGLCSRREADAFIERGWVLVDGVPVTELGSKARPDAKLELAPAAATRQDQQMTLLLHKPVGYVSGQPEPGFQPAVVLIRPESQARGAGDPVFQPRWLQGLAPAGRLDIDSTGLLVLTQDGRVARQLIGDESTVDKEYLVRVEGRLIPDGLALLNHGLELDGKRLKPARVEWLNDDQLRFVLREGRKRQIRRMCELVGLTVVGLKRVRIGQVRLGDLPLGQWRCLRPGETF